MTTLTTLIKNNYNQFTNKMKKITLLLFACLLTTVGTWAQSLTTDWIDYSTTFHNATWTNYPNTSDDTWKYKVVSTLPSVYELPVTIQVNSEENALAYGTREGYLRPWLKAKKSYNISVPEGYIIASYEIKTMATNASATGTFTYTTSNGGTETSATQNGTLSTITVDNLNAQTFTLDLSAYPENGINGIFVYELRIKFVAVNITVSAFKGDATTATYTGTKLLPYTTGNFNLNNFFVANGLLDYENKTVTFTSDDNQAFSIKYTESAVPFASSYEELTSDNKWFSMFTLNGRMHVYETNEDGSNVAKYPTIDKATFTRLNDNFFWGFVCENPFTSAVKIVNKGAGANKTLYLTSNGNDVPVLLYTKQEADANSALVTNEWILEKSANLEIPTLDPSNVGKYFGIKANGTTRYINNNANKGFMTTWQDNATKDAGSSHKFTIERATYEIMKDRALSAPCDAAHSLNQTSRQKIKDVDATIAAMSDATDAEVIDKYKEVIKNINDNNGFIEFVEDGYYFLRNYTPANGIVFALGSTDGVNRAAIEVSAEDAGSESVVMKSANVNLIWKITTSNSTAASGTGVGASRTIARKVTHVNSGKRLAGIGTAALAASNAGADYYFVELGAGQHFMKNAQYNGSGQQARAHPLSCTDAGVIKEGANRHLKNSRDAWYGIQVKSIDVKISAAGYATLFLPFGVTIPEGSALEAYAITGTTAAAGTESGKAIMKKVTDIPANKGVILKAAEGTYQLTIDDDVTWEWETAENSNLLKGSCMSEKITEDAYVLSQQGGKVGLYKAAKNQQVTTANDSWLNNSNKAYLPADAVAGARYFLFDFGTETGIDVIQGTEPSTSTETVVYDLSGRRVQSAQKGIYVINGKKVIK